MLKAAFFNSFFRTCVVCVGRIQPFTLEFTIDHAFPHVQNCFAATRFAAEERPVSMFQFSHPLYIKVNMLPTLF
jgi:hypothetical protein